MSSSLRPYRLQPTKLLCPWYSPGKNTGVGSYSLLQGIFPDQTCLLHLLHCRRIIYHWATGEAQVLSAAAAAAKSLQSCPTMCDPIDGSQPGFPVPGNLQARTLEWVAISFSNAWKWKVKVVSNSQRPHGLQPTRLLHPCRISFFQQNHW